MAEPTRTWRYHNEGTTDGSYAAEPSHYTTMTPGTNGKSFLGSAPSTLTNTTAAQATEAAIIIPTAGSQNHGKCYIMPTETYPITGTLVLVPFCSDAEVGANRRYVFCISFSGATASTPYLEYWDTSAHSTYNLAVLGGGTPANSMVRCIATTNGEPGANWTGTPMAGSGDSNRIALDTGPLTGAKDLYFNEKIVVPNGSSPFVNTPVETLRFEKGAYGSNVIRKTRLTSVKPKSKDMAIPRGASPVETHIAVLPRKSMAAIIRLAA